MNQPAILDGAALAYSISISTGLVNDQLGVNLHLEKVNSPLIDHVSILLDIDVYRHDLNVPQSPNEIRALLDIIRARRTEIFEQCITDTTRALIS